MNNQFFQRDILSTHEFSRDEVEYILAHTKQIKNKAYPTLLQDKIIASCFFEPSTRTRLSFETAAHRLGARVIGFSSNENLSIKKGENLHDTIRVIDHYADLIIIRHAQEGAARLAAEIANQPVINAGDGTNQHPTQALTDLFTMQECQQRLDGLSIALVGDLKYGRTINSFIELCALFDIRFYFVSSEMLAVPESTCDKLKKLGVRFSYHQTLEEVIPNIDILYMTRIQQERFSQAAYENAKNQFILTPEILKQARTNLQVLHPLPRLKEISVEVDALPFAHYFKQASNAVPLRQALLTLALHEKLL